MVPRTERGRRVRDVLARSSLMRAAGAVERGLQRRTARPLPEYRRPARPAA
ncbi:hypothetical protein [Actinomadura logoneensis]|uniref:hypothetical protein n=1 Tax=Actinomadura logoneensis TaxID=2293572 RepID=UPI001314CF78|nr:hypothetical protein [Actinomadura logoneensis]